MEQKGLEDFLANAALLAAHLSQQCDKASSELQQTASAFRQDVTQGQAQFASTTRSALRESLAAEIPAAIQGLGEATDRFHRMAERLQVQQQSLDRHARFLGWKSLASIAIAAVVVLAATGYVAWENVKRAQEAQVQAAVLQALEQVTITSCDGHPCIKLEDGLRRWPKNDEYVLVDVAPATRLDAGP